MIALSILRESVNPKQLLGSKKTFLSMRIQRVRDSKFGDDWMVVQGVARSALDAGERGPILGNGRNVGAVHDYDLIEGMVDTSLFDKKLYYPGRKGNYIKLKLVYPTKADGDTDADYIIWQEVTSDADKLTFKKGPKVGGAKKSFYRKKQEDEPRRAEPVASASRAEPAAPVEADPVPSGDFDEQDYPF